MTALPHPWPSPFDFAGQTVLITGATRGLGRGIAEAFLANGARVLGTYRGNEEAAAGFRDLAAQRQWSLELFKFDVSDPAQVDAFFAQTADAAPELHVLVNNSGIRRDALFAMMKVEDWRAVLDTNLTGSFLMSKAAVQRMLPQRFGRIIHITSPSGLEGFPGQANYSASKAGQIGLMRAMAKEVASRNITVNCVSPGFCETELLADLPPDQLAEYKRRIPMRRFGRPDDVAAAVLFLASRPAAYITGAVLDVTGGL